MGFSTMVEVLRAVCSKKEEQAISRFLLKRK
jgi:hypothetical protein